MANLQYANLTSPVEKDVPMFISSSLTAGTFLAGQIYYAQFQKNPQLPNSLVDEYTVPSTETDILFGIYVSSVPVVVDGALTFKVNETDAEIQYQPISNSYINLQHPQSFTHTMMLPPNQRLNAVFIPLSNVVTTANQTVWVRFMRVPLGYKGTVTIPSR
jgi:hypothetical protein